MKIINNDVDLKARYTKAAKILAVLIVLLALVYFTLLILSGRALANAYKELEDAGRPMSSAEIIPDPISDEDNAAVVYQAVESQLRSEPAGEQNLLDRASELSQKLLDGDAKEEEVVELQGLMELPTMTRALKVLEGAALKSGCRYDLAYEDGAATLLPHLSKNRALSRILCASALLRAQRGDVSGAWDQLILGARMANDLREEPLLISQLVRLAQAGITMHAIAKVAAIGPPTAGQANQLDALLERFDDMDAFQDALDGERLLLGEWAFNLPGSKFAEVGTSTKEARAISYYAKCKPLFQRDHAAYLTVMHGYGAIATKPFDRKRLVELVKIYGQGN